ncbi:MAG: DUF2961 domain-containing protein [bacterium]
MPVTAVSCVKGASRKLEFLTQPAMFRKYNRYISFIGNPIFIPVLCLFLMNCGPSAPPGAQNRQLAQEVLPPIPALPEDVMDTAYFLNRIADFSSLAVPRPDERMLLVSSHTDDATDSDTIPLLEQYKLDGTLWKVLADEKGPGCITRLWCSGNARGRLRIILDNQAEPVIDTTLVDFFSGNYGHFKPFLVNPPDASAGGNVCYFPIPFARQCTILTDSTDPDFQYQVNFLKLNTDKKVVSYRPEPDSAVQIILQHIARHADPDFITDLIHTSREKTDSIQLQPGEKKVILTQKGPAAFFYLHFHLEPFTDEVLNQVQVRMLWDNLRDPAVDCTLAQLFCHTSSAVGWSNLLMGSIPEEQILYSRFFMPFFSQAQIQLENLTEEPVQIALSYQLQTRDLSPELLYFFAYHQERQLIHGFTYPLMDMEAQGNFIGASVMTSSQSVGEPLFYLEGDEFFYVDGEEHPSWSGTGGDHYFNGDEKFTSAPYWTPLYGCFVKDASGGGMTNNYRFHLLDAIPFQHSLLSLQEIGSPRKYLRMDTPTIAHATCSWTYYWYAQPSSGSVPRRERLFYFAVSKSEKGQPGLQSPVLRDLNMPIKLPEGTYWIHIAPRMDLTQVQHIKQVVEQGTE